MRKINYLIITLFIFFLFLGCKTPPVQKSINNINKSIVGVLSDSQSEIKLYFPELFVYDNNTQKNVMASGDCIIVKMRDGEIRRYRDFSNFDRI